MMNRRFGWLVVLVLALTVIWLVACDSRSDDPTDGDAPVDGDADGDAPADGDVDGDVDPDGDVVAQDPFDYCEAGTAPDAECWAQKRQPDSEQIALAVAIADKQIAIKNPADLKWDWGEAVMMIGMAELYKVTGHERYLDFITAWLDHHIETGFSVEDKDMIGSSDTCAPAALAVFAYAQTGEQKYRDVAHAGLDYIYNEAMRTDYGGLNHLGVIDFLGVAIWVDSLFMVGNVLTSWGELEGDIQALDEIDEQFEIFGDTLQKPIGFYTHASEECNFEQEPGIYWGRGNGWVLAAGFDHLRVRKNRGESLPAMTEDLNALLQAAIAHQDSETGMWYTVMNRPEAEGNYLETSAGALFAFGMARGWRYGYLDDSVLPVIRKAIDGVKSRIAKDDDNDPVVTGVSGPTNPSTTDGYISIRQPDDVSYGVGAVLLALIETSGLPE